MATDRKSYNQRCPMATALDVVGDRWTMLILRELLGGAARFNELRDGLPGIAGNLLTKRLRLLEEDGLIRQTKMHNTTVYVLTDDGEAIRPTLEELAFWGTRLTRVGPVLHERSIRALAMALHSVFVHAGEALPTERFVIEVDVDGEPMEITLSPNPTVIARPATTPDARLWTTYEGISAVLRGEVERSLFTKITGDEVAVQFLFDALA